jgi:predicted GTPase
MGYSPEQLADLAATIAAVPCDAVVVATPIDLARLIDIEKDAVRIGYEVRDREAPLLRDTIDDFLRERNLV